MQIVRVTSAVDLIGFHSALRLLESGDRVVGLDDLNPYYDVALKEARLAKLGLHEAFTFVRADIGDEDAVKCV